MGCIGFDVGTYNLVCATRDADGNIKCKRGINSFIQIPLDNKYMFNMFKKSNVPLIEKDGVAYVLGEAAVNMAYAFDKVVLRRPMKDGCVNPSEKEAFFILNAMMQGLIGEVEKGDELLYYTVPANAINENTDADYHQKILDVCFKKYNTNGKTLKPSPINEALAIIFAELENKAYTGLGISCGAGQVNVCYAMYSVPVFSFSIVNSGDWIDQQAAKATSESINFINKEKAKIDLTKSPTNLVERAIQTQYRIMIEKTVKGIKKGMEESGSKVRSEDPVDIVISGGTSTPNGFEVWFKEVVDDIKLPVEIGEIRKPEDTLYCVARGCLIAAENAVG